MSSRYKLWECEGIDLGTWSNPLFIMQQQRRGQCSTHMNDLGMPLGTACMKWASLCGIIKKKRTEEEKEEERWSSSSHSQKHGQPKSALIHYNPSDNMKCKKNEGILRDRWAKAFISTRNFLPPLKFHTGYLDLEILNNQHNRCLHGHALVTKEVQGHKKRKKIWKEGDFFWVISWNFVNKVEISWKKLT